MCGTEIFKRLEDFCFWFLLGSKRQEKSAWYIENWSGWVLFDHELGYQAIQAFYLHLLTRMEAITPS